MTKAMYRKLASMRHGKRVPTGRGCGAMMSRLHGMGLVRCHLSPVVGMGHRWSITDAGLKAITEGIA